MDAICISVITAAELRFGCAKRASPRLTSTIEALLSELDVLLFAGPADAEYPDIRHALEQEGKPIGPNDLLIAAHARAVGPVLVTANAKEFGRVRDLTIENWLA